MRSYSLLLYLGCLCLTGASGASGGAESPLGVVPKNVQFEYPDQSSAADDASDPEPSDHEYAAIARLHFKSLDARDREGTTFAATQAQLKAGFEIDDGQRVPVGKSVRVEIADFPLMASTDGHSAAREQRSKHTYTLALEMHHKSEFGKVTNPWELTRVFLNGQELGGEGFPQRSGVLRKGDGSCLAEQRVKLTEGKNRSGQGFLDALFSSNEGYARKRDLSVSFSRISRTPGQRFLGDEQEEHIHTFGAMAWVEIAKAFWDVAGFEEASLQDASHFHLQGSYEKISLWAPLVNFLLEKPTLYVAAGFVKETQNLQTELVMEDELASEHKPSTPWQLKQNTMDKWRKANEDMLRQITSDAWGTEEGAVIRDDEFAFALSKESRDREDKDERREILEKAITQAPTTLLDVWKVLQKRAHSDRNNGNVADVYEGITRVLERRIIAVLLSRITSEEEARARLMNDDIGEALESDSSSNKPYSHYLQRVVQYFDDDNNKLVKRAKKQELGVLLNRNWFGSRKAGDWARYAK